MLINTTVYQGRHASTKHWLCLE